MEEIIIGVLKEEKVVGAPSLREGENQVPKMLNFGK
jgi:hypothetical protein